MLAGSPREVEMERAAPRALGDVLALSGIRLTAHVTARPERIVEQVVLYDSLDGRADLRGAIVLAFGGDAGLEDLAHVIRTLAAGEALAAVVRDADVPASIRSLAAGRGLCLLSLPPEVSWDQAFTRLRAAASLDPAATGAPPGDLHALADWGAALLGGPLVILGTDLHLLAHSAGGEIDDQRRDTLLRRQKPAEWPAALRARLWAGEVADVSAPGARDRLLVAARAGDEVVGIVCVHAGAEPFPADARELLAEVGRAAGERILGAEAPAPGSWGTRGDALRALLDGARDAATLVALQIPAGVERLALIALRLAPGWSAHVPDPGRLPAFAAMHSAGCRDAIAVRDGDVVAVLVGFADEDPETEAAAHAEHLRAALGAFTGGPATAYVGAVVERPEDVHRSVRDIELMRRLPLAPGGLHRPDGLSSDLVLEELRELLGGSEALAAGPGARLARTDMRDGTDYVRTVRAFVDALGNTQVAARELGVHPNTVRYRLRRIQQEAEIDLDDPEQRLALDVELRLRFREPTLR